MYKSKGTEEENDQGAIETKLETVDYRSPAGTEDKEAEKEKVAVVHLMRDDGRSGGGGGFLRGAADAVAKSLKATKEAVWNRDKDCKK